MASGSEVFLCLQDTCGYESMQSWKGHDEVLASSGAPLSHPPDIFSRAPGHHHMAGFSLRHRQVLP